MKEPHVEFVATGSQEYLRDRVPDPRPEVTSAA